MHPLVKIFILILVIQALQLAYLLEVAWRHHDGFRARYVPLYLAGIILLWTAIRLALNLRLGVGGWL